MKRSSSHFRQSTHGYDILVLLSCAPTPVHCLNSMSWLAARVEDRQAADVVENVATVRGRLETYAHAIVCCVAYTSDMHAAWGVQFGWSTSLRKHLRSSSRALRSEHLTESEQPNSEAVQLDSKSLRIRSASAGPIQLHWQICPLAAWVHDHLSHATSIGASSMLLPYRCPLRYSLRLVALGSRWNSTLCKGPSMRATQLTQHRW